MANPTSGTLVDCAMVDWVGFRARIIEENISNRIDSNRLVLLNRLEVSDDWSKNESPRRHL